MFSRICVFSVLRFFGQTSCKNHDGNRSREKLSNKSLRDPPGSHFGPQNRLKSCARRPKNQKNTKKSSFGREPFFDNFFDRIFYQSLKFVKIIGMVGPVFAKRSRKTSICCFVGALGCSRVPPDTFFVDFGADLGWIFDTFGTISGMHFLHRNA